MRTELLRQATSVLRTPTRWATRFALVVIAGACLHVAGSRVSPAIAPEDSGEMQLVLRELGIAHPPGYPLYTITGHFFGRIASQPLVARALNAPTALTAPDAARGSSRPTEPDADLWTWSANLYAAALALVTLVVVFVTARTLTGSNAGGLVGVATLAASPAFLAQSGVANVRMPTALFAALLLLAASRRPPATARAAAAIGALATLALGHHGSLVFVAAPAALAVLANTARHMRTMEPRNWMRLAVAAGLGGLVGLAPQAYLPWRDRQAPDLAPADLTTLAGFLEHTTAAGFRGDMFAYRDGQIILDRLIVVADIFRAQFPWPVLAVAVAGTLWLLAGAPGAVNSRSSRSPRNASAAAHNDGPLPSSATPAGPSGGAAAVHNEGPLRSSATPAGPSGDTQRRATIATALDRGRVRLAGLAIAASLLALTAAAVTYRAPQTVEYLLPAYVAVAVAAGCAGGAVVRAAAALSNRRRGVRSGQWPPARGGGASVWLARAAVYGGAALLLLLGGRHARHTAAAWRAQSPPASFLAHDCGGAGRILASWHYSSGLRYAARHIYDRPDVEVVYVFPEGAEPIGATWLRRLRTMDTVYLLTDRPGEVAHAGISLWPAARGPYFATAPIDCQSNDSWRLPADADDPIDFGPVALTGVRMSGPTADAPVSVDLRFAPAPTQTITESLTVFLQLVDDFGAVWGQADINVPAERWNDLRGVVVRSALMPFRDAPPPQLHVIGGLYHSGPNGPVRLATGSADSVTLGHLNTDHWPRWPAPPSGSIPFGQAMTLLSSAVAADQNEMVIDLSWRADMAYASDYRISVQAFSDSWQAQHDGTPSQGAVPTLKWLPGMVFRDRHRVPLPDGATADESLRITVAVYDGFTMTPLPVTDRARAAAGQGQFAVVYPVE